MRILVTGASGFTGRHFTRLARTSGYEVHELTSNILNKRSLFDEVARCSPDFVVHLAAISFVQHAKTPDFFDVNVIGTQNLLESLVRLKQRPKRILLASSSSVYGNAANPPVAETSAFDPVNAYGESKARMEAISRNFSDELGIIITRPFNYTGVGQSTNFLIPKIVAHFARLESVMRLGNIDISREFNDVRFVSSAYLALLQNGSAVETYNICSGRVFSVREILTIFRRLTGHQIVVEFDRDFARRYEVETFFGSPEKLRRYLDPATQPPLKETLDWMIRLN